MWNPVEIWLKEVVVYKHAFQEALASEAELVFRNICTAPKEVPIAFWSGIAIMLYIMLQRRKREK